MKKILLASVFVLTACTPDPTVVVRIDCGEHNNQELQVELNRKSSGTCPMDMMIHAGDLTVTARKDNEDASYLYGEAKMTLAENAMKRINLDVQPVYTEEYYFRRAIDVDGIDNYLKHQPNGKRKPELESKLEKIYFDAAKDVDGMTAYIDLYPNGSYVKEVRENLESTLAEIERKKNEAIALEKQRKEQAELKRKESQQKRFLSVGFSDNEDGTVTQVDNGVVWARCQYPKIMKGSSCFGSDSLYNPSSFVIKAQDWGVSKVNGISYMKRDDWRLMTKEAEKILCSGSNREILGEIFPDFDIKKCWEFAPKESGFFVRQPSVYLYSSGTAGRSGYVRLIRFPVSLPSSYTKRINDRLSKLKFVDNGNGTIIDQSTGLMWSRCVSGQKFNLITCDGIAKKYSWDESMLVAKKTNLAGFTDWRVPSTEEIKSILHCTSGYRENGYCNENATDPFFDVYIFPNLDHADGIWTNKKFQEILGRDDRAEEFYRGGPREERAISSEAVLLVRGGK